MGLVRWQRKLFLLVLVTVMSYRNLWGVGAQTSSPPTNLALSPDDNSGTISQAITAQFNQALNMITETIQKKYSDCFENFEKDKRNTFDFSKNSTLALLSECENDVGADLMSRVCGQAEIELYFSDILSITTTGISANINCNPDSQPKACESGWAGVASNFSLLTRTTFIPERSADPKSCCAGFFCPPGLTCMMPCPLGAFCPRAFYSATKGICYPYRYMPKPGNASLACGGADVWSQYKTSSGLFCSGNSSASESKYCPDTITEAICDKGHFCRTGSTFPAKCSFLSICKKEGRRTENLLSYGGLVIALLFIILLIIYNFSDLLMHVRERRKSKVREIAARQARESISALERWRRAKEAVRITRTNAVKFAGEMTRTVSGGKSNFSNTHGTRSQPRPGALPGAHNDRYGDGQIGASSGAYIATRSDSMLEDLSDEGSLQEQEFHLRRDHSSAPRQSPSLLLSQELYPAIGPLGSDLYEAVQVPPVSSHQTEEEIPSARENEVSGSRNRSEKEIPSLRETKVRGSSTRSLAHTHSQIYKYAYGQIERERIEQISKPTSFEGLVASDRFRNMLNTRGRPQLEVSFVDLSLILKGSGRRILSHVTGKFYPCRVTAVMGPSGAGKTTFLNALAGKETGSRITGEVFINGLPGSIQSYKRIIGFVPQDDIVHSTLTVEENLSFSAKYRLPSNTPKQERVLVVERIINTLGLTSIRDSLVGNVEKRGISGGQRKRVNVAMELVIEPSLLILDEPTSGLDSTASRLVLQCLRREATLGVNVFLVLHQPSHALFRMFDDVMLLAKGGYTVYLGPVDEIESYFESLGFDMPDHTNPPDYFIDVLEGLIVQGSDPSFDLKSLPVLWMCNNGYPIPRDLQETAEGFKRAGSSTISYDAQKTFIQDIWDELRVYLLVRWDIFKTTFASVKDLSGRRTPGFISQYCLIVERVTKQKLREASSLAQDYIILLLAGICLGVMAEWKDENLVGNGYMYTIIAVALLVMVASLRTFSADKLEFWRESSSGINKVAFFLAKDTVDHFQTLVKPVVYLSMFYFFNDPRSSFVSNYVITLALVYCSTGIGYIQAIALNPQPAQLVSVFIPIVATLLVADGHKGVLQTLQNFSYAKWALEAYDITNFKRYTGVWLITRCETLVKSGYKLKNNYLCLAVLFGYGVGARLVAFLCLLFAHRKRQK